MPREVHRKVIELAGPGALVIEMQWSNSQYLPAHNGGEKYKELLGQDAVFGRCVCFDLVAEMLFECV